MGYQNVVRASTPNKQAGYKDLLYFSPVTDIATWQYPISVPVAIGDKKTISTAHTWATGKAANTWETKLGTIQLTYETGGEYGGKERIFVARAEIIGDSAAIDEMIADMLNDNLVVFLKDANCLAGGPFIQLGDECNAASLTVATFDSGTNNAEQATGNKKHVLEIRSKVRYFYNAAVDLTA